MSLKVSSHLEEFTKASYDGIKDKSTKVKVGFHRMQISARPLQLYFESSHLGEFINGGLS